MGELVGQRGRTQNYRELLVWQKAMALVLSVYKVSATFPADERYGLTSQMRRSAVSVPSNIAEGHGRLSDKWLRSFLTIARGSLFELETQMTLAADLGFAMRDAANAVLAQATEIARMLNGFLRTLEVEARRIS